MKTILVQVAALVLAVLVGALFYQYVQVIPLFLVVCKIAASLGVGLVVYSLVMKAVQ